MVLLNVVSGLPRMLGPAAAGADEMLEQQRVTRNHMQGGEPTGEYSTYAEDTAELKARFQRVDVSAPNILVYSATRPQTCLVTTCDCLSRLA